MKSKRLQDQYDNELKTIELLERNLWQVAKEEKGLNNLQSWKSTCQLSSEITKLGEKLLKAGEYQEAEAWFLRAKEFTEPSLEKTVWLHQVDWFYIRINIALNLNKIYTPDRKFEECFILLNSITEQCQKSHLFTMIWQNIESNIDYAYSQLMLACMGQKKYEEAINACKKCINIIDFYEKEYKKQEELVAQNKHELLMQTYTINSQTAPAIYLHHPELIKKKLILRTDCFYQGGRALQKHGDKRTALKFLKMAWKKATEIFPETDSRIILYRRKYEKVRGQLEFNNNLNNESVGDFSKFTTDVNKAHFEDQINSAQLLHLKKSSSSNHQPQQQQKHQLLQQQQQQQQQLQQQPRMIIPDFTHPVSQSQTTNIDHKMSTYLPHSLVQGIQFYDTNPATATANHSTTTTSGINNFKKEQSSNQKQFHSSKLTQLKRNQPFSASEKSLRKTKSIHFTASNTQEAYRNSEHWESNSIRNKRNFSSHVTGTAGGGAATTISSNSNQQQSLVDQKSKQSSVPSIGLKKKSLEDLLLEIHPDEEQEQTKQPISDDPFNQKITRGLSFTTKKQALIQNQRSVSLSAAENTVPASINNNNNNNTSQKKLQVKSTQQNQQIDPLDLYALKSADNKPRFSENTEKLRSQLDNFFSHRKATQSQPEAVKKIRKYYEQAFGNSQQEANNTTNSNPTQQLPQPPQSDIKYPPDDTSQNPQTSQPNMKQRYFLSAKNPLSQGTFELGSSTSTDNLSIKPTPLTKKQSRSAYHSQSQLPITQQATSLLQDQILPKQTRITPASSIHQRSIYSRPQSPSTHLSQKGSSIGEKSRPVSQYEQNDVQTILSDIEGIIVKKEITPVKPQARQLFIFANNQTKVLQGIESSNPHLKKQQPSNQQQYDQIDKQKNKLLFSTKQISNIQHPPPQQEKVQRNYYIKSELLKGEKKSKIYGEIDMIFSKEKIFKHKLSSTAIELMSITAPSNKNTSTFDQIPFVSESKDNTAHHLNSIATTPAGGIPRNKLNFIALQPRPQLKHNNNNNILLATNNHDIPTPELGNKQTTQEDKVQIGEFEMQGYANSSVQSQRSINQVQGQSQLTGTYSNEKQGSRAQNDTTMHSSVQNNNKQGTVTQAVVTTGSGGQPRMKKVESQSSFSNLTPHQINSYMMKKSGNQSQLFPQPPSPSMSQLYSASIYQQSGGGTATGATQQLLNPSSLQQLHLQSNQSSNLQLNSQQNLQGGIGDKRTSSLSRVASKRTIQLINNPSPNSLTIGKGAIKTTVSLAAMPEDEQDQIEDANSKLKNQSKISGQPEESVLHEYDSTSQLRNGNTQPQFNELEHSLVFLHHSQSMQQPGQTPNKSVVKEEKKPFILNKAYSFRDRRISQPSSNKEILRRTKSEKKIKSQTDIEEYELKKKIEALRSEPIKRSQAALKIQRIWRKHRGIVHTPDTNKPEQHHQRHNLDQIESNQHTHPGTTSILNPQHFQYGSGTSIIHDPHQQQKQSKISIILTAESIPNNLKFHEVTTQSTTSQHFGKHHHSQNRNPKNTADGSSLSYHNVHQKQGLSGFNNVTNPSMYAKSQHHFPLENSFESKNQQRSSFNHNNLPASQFHRNTNSVASRSQSTMSLFTEFSKKEQTNDAKLIFKKVGTQKPIPLKFYIYKTQKGNSFWKLSDITMHFTPVGEEVNTTILFDLTILQFTGRLSVSFKMSIAEFLETSKTENLTKWEAANLFFDMFFARVGLTQKWVEFQEEVQNSSEEQPNYSSFLLLDNILNLQQSRFVALNQKVFEPAPSWNKDHPYIVSMVKLFEKLSFFLPNYTVFINKMCGESLNLVDFTQQQPPTRQQVKQTKQKKQNLSKECYDAYEKNIRLLHAFLKERKNNIQQLMKRNPNYSPRQQGTEQRILKNMPELEKNSDISDSSSSMQNSEESSSRHSKCSIDDEIDPNEPASPVYRKIPSSANTSILKNQIRSTRQRIFESEATSFQHLPSEGQNPGQSFGASQTSIMAPNLRQQQQQFSPPNKTGNIHSNTNTSSEVNNQIRMEEDNIRSKTTRDLAQNPNSEFKRGLTGTRLNQTQRVSVGKKISFLGTQPLFSPIHQGQGSPGGVSHPSLFSSFNQQNSSQSPTNSQIKQQQQLQQQQPNQNKTKRSSLFFHQKILESSNRSEKNEGEESLSKKEESSSESSSQSRLLDNQSPSWSLGNPQDSSPQTTPLQQKTSPQRTQYQPYPAKQMLKSEMLVNNANSHQKIGSPSLRMKQAHSLVQGTSVINPNLYQRTSENSPMIMRSSTQRNDHFSIPNTSIDFMHHSLKQQYPHASSPFGTEQQIDRLHTNEFGVFPSSVVDEIDQANFESIKMYSSIKYQIKQRNTIIEEQHNPEEPLLHPKESLDSFNIQQSSFEKNSESHLLRRNTKQASIVSLPYVRVNKAKDLESKPDVINNRQRMAIERKRKKTIIAQRVRSESYWGRFNYFGESTPNIYTQIPDTFINPFLQEEILVKSIIKKNKEYYLVILRMRNKQQNEDFIDVESKIGMEIALEIFKTPFEGKWHDEMSFNLFDFIDEFFPSNDLDILSLSCERKKQEQLLSSFHLDYRFQRKFKFNQFLYNRGFNVKQSQLMQKQLQSKVNIDSSRVHLIWTTSYQHQLKQNSKQQEKQELKAQQEHEQQQQQQQQQKQRKSIVAKKQKSLLHQLRRSQGELNVEIECEDDLANIGTRDRFKRNSELSPKKRDFDSDIILIKDLLEESDLRDMQRIIFKNQKLGKPEDDFKYFQVKLIEEQKKDNQQPPEDTVPLVLKNFYKNIPKKTVNFQGLLEKRGSMVDTNTKPRGSIRSPFTLITNILKVSAKLKSNIVKIEHNVNKTLGDQNNEHFSRVNERTLVSSGDVQILEYYNTACKIDLGKHRIRYCIRDQRTGFLQSLYIEFIKSKQGTSSNNSNTEKRALVILEDRLNRYRCEKIQIRGSERVEKLINLIQQHQESSIPVLKMNFLRFNNGFFSQVRFDSYIERSKEHHINTILSMYNEKDEALFDLLSNSKLSDPNYMQLFLARIKFRLISDCATPLRQSDQNFLLHAYFVSQRCTQVCIIQDLGRVFIQSTVYSVNPLFSSHKSVFICLHILTKQMRAFSKFILTIQDIQQFIQKDFTEEVCLDKIKIIKMVSLLSEKLRYLKSSQFYNFRLPLSSLTKNSKKDKYDLVNNFDLTPEPFSFTHSILSNKTFLTPILRSSRVIFTTTKKIANQYTIFTIKRFGILDYYSVEIYIPRSGRRWCTSIYTCDLREFKSQFMEELFPYMIWDRPQILDPILAFKKNRYLEFSKRYEYQILKDPLQYIHQVYSEQYFQQYPEECNTTPIPQITLQVEDVKQHSRFQQRQQSRSKSNRKKPSFLRNDRRKPSHVENDSNKKQLLSAEPNKVATSAAVATASSVVATASRSTQRKLTFSEFIEGDTQEHKSRLEQKKEQPASSYKQKPSQFLRLFEKNALSVTNVLETKIWEKLIEKMEVQVNQQEKLILKIDTFSGLIKELLGQSVIHLRSGENVQISITFEKRPAQLKSHLISTTIGQGQIRQEKKARDSLLAISNRNIKRPATTLQIPNIEKQVFSLNNQSLKQDPIIEVLSASSRTLDLDSSYSSQPLVHPSPKGNSSNSNNNLLESSSVHSPLGSSVDEVADDYLKVIKQQYEQEFIEKELLGRSMSFYTEEAAQWDVYIRINFYERLQTENDKLNMSMLLKQYFKENKIHLKQFKERFRTAKQKKAAPKNVIQKPPTTLRNPVDTQFKSTPQIGNKMARILQSAVMNFAGQQQFNNNKTSPEKKDEGDSQLFSENFCFVNSDFTAMAAMIKNKIKENYLPPSLSEDEEYFRQQYYRQGKAFQHFENVIKVNRERRTTLASELADESPTNSNNEGKKSGSKNYLAPNTYLSDQIPSKIKSENPLNNLDPLKSLKDPSQSNNTAIPPKFSLLERVLQAGRKQKEEAQSTKQGEIIKQNRFGGSNQLKSILLAQPAFFSNMEEAVRFQPKAKINCEINIQRLIDPHKQHFIMMFRGVFTRKPFQMIAIYYKTSKKIFFAEIWNVSTQQKIKQKIPLDLIFKQIPFVKQLLSLKSYQEIGRRIFLTFKNSLMISSFDII